MTIAEFSERVAQAYGSPALAFKALRGSGSSDDRKIVDISNFVKFAGNLHPGISSDEAVPIFRQLDSDHSGGLSEGELNLGLQPLSPPANKTAAASSSSTRGAAAAPPAAGHSAGGERGAEDASGRLSMAALLERMAAAFPSPADAFQALDATPDNMDAVLDRNPISRAQFVEGTKLWVPPLTTAQAEAAFGSLDVDGSGRLEMQEFMDAVERGRFVKGVLDTPHAATSGSIANETTKKAKQPISGQATDAAAASDQAMRPTSGKATDAAAASAAQDTSASTDDGSRAEQGCAGEERICMAGFRSRMRAAYGSSLDAFAAMHGAFPSSAAPRLPEFLGMVKAFDPPLTRKQAEYAFRGLDMDGNGALPSYEFFEVIDSGHFSPNDWQVEAVAGEAALPRRETQAAAEGGPRRASREGEVPAAGPAASAAFGGVGGLWQALAKTGAGVVIGALLCWAGLRAWGGLRARPEEDGNGDERGPRDARMSYKLMHLAAMENAIDPDVSHQRGPTHAARLMHVRKHEAEEEELRDSDIMTFFRCCGTSSHRPMSSNVPSW